MRLASLALATFYVAVSPPAASQEWLTNEWRAYGSMLDRFGIAFPARPKITQTTWSTEYHNKLPARVYSYEEGPDLFSITVVDYTDIERIDGERVKACVLAGGEGDTCQSEWVKDVQGSVAYAIWTFLQRPGEITHFSWYWVNQVASHRLQMNNPDGGRTYATFHQHADRLIITEATVAAGRPEPLVFRETLAFLDEDGQMVRYAASHVLYTNGYGRWQFPTPVLETPARPVDPDSEYEEEEERQFLN